MPDTVFEHISDSHTMPIAFQPSLFEELGEEPRLGIRSRPIRPR
jgi:hypothetical protein